jgi:hypothetical protein
MAIGAIWVVSSGAQGRRVSSIGMDSPVWLSAISKKRLMDHLMASLNIGWPRPPLSQASSGARKQGVAPKRPASGARKQGVAPKRPPRGGPEKAPQTRGGPEKARKGPEKERPGKGTRIWGDWAVP